MMLIFTGTTLGYRWWSIMSILRGGCVFYNIPYLKHAIFSKKNSRHSKNRWLGCWCWLKCMKSEGKGNIYHRWFIAKLRHNVWWSFSYSYSLIIWLFFTSFQSPFPMRLYLTSGKMTHHKENLSPLPSHLIKHLSKIKSFLLNEL